VFKKLLYGWPLTAACTVNLAVGGFERIFGATLFFGTDTMAGKAKLVQRIRFNFVQEAQIWCDRRLDQSALSDQFEPATESGAKEIRPD
jgi:hypothetical protein